VIDKNRQQNSNKLPKSGERSLLETNAEMCVSEKIIAILSLKTRSTFQQLREKLLTVTKRRWRYQFVEAPCLNAQK